MNLSSVKAPIYNRLITPTHLPVFIFFYVPQNVDCYCFFRKIRIHPPWWVHGAPTKSAIASSMVHAVLLSNILT